MGHARSIPVLSSDIIATGSGLNACMLFFKKTTPLQPTIGQLFEGIDLQAYNKYRQTYDAWWEDTALAVVCTTTRACFLGTAVVGNKRVGPHKDVGDRRDGWVAMIVLGDFTGGEVVLPGLKVQLLHRPGDVIFFRSAVLEHFVAPFKGERTEVVFFTKNDLFEERLV